MPAQVGSILLVGIGFRGFDPITAQPFPVVVLAIELSPGFAAVRGEPSHDGEVRLGFGGQSILLAPKSKSPVFVPRLRGRQVLTLVFGEQTHARPGSALICSATGSTGFQRPKFGDVAEESMCSGVGGVDLATAFFRCGCRSASRPSFSHQSARPTWAFAPHAGLFSGDSVRLDLIGRRGLNRRRCGRLHALCFTAPRPFGRVRSQPAEELVGQGLRCLLEKNRACDEHDFPLAPGHPADHEGTGGARHCGCRANPMAWQNRDTGTPCCLPRRGPLASPP